MEVLRSNSRSYERIHMTLTENSQLTGILKTGKEHRKPQAGRGQPQTPGTEGQSGASSPGSSVGEG